jgi:hypothetical protein
MTITRMALMAWMTGTAADAGQPEQIVTVYLRDRANARAMVRIPAEALAGRMFAGIGIFLEWCKGEPAVEPSQPPVIVELVTETPENLMPGSLAYALPYEGTHITVFFDRVERTRCPSTVLAHVMVHEITHLLQGINRHAATGVMKEWWTVRDFSDMRYKPLAFTAMDVDLIYSGLPKPTAGAGVLLAGR